MAREQFETKLTELKNQVVRMSEMANSALNQAIQALDSHDENIAQNVIDHDKQINALEDEINNYAIWLIAKEQPVAKDLRFLITTLKVTNDIERIGDLAVNIAKSVKIISKEKTSADKENIFVMTEMVQNMVTAMTEAYTSENIEKAYQIAEMDDQVDQIYEDTIGKILAYMALNQHEIKGVTQLAFICRYLERVGDHVTNICENIIYLVKGKYLDLNNKKLSTIDFC